MWRLAACSLTSRVLSSRPPRGTLMRPCTVNAFRVIGGACWNSRAELTLSFWVSESHKFPEVGGHPWTNRVQI